MKKRILLICTNSDEAGAPRHVEMIVNTLSSRLDFIFVTGEKGPVFFRLLNLGIECHYISGLRNEISPIRDLFVFAKLLILCRNMDFDLMHLHSAKAGLLGRLVSMMLNKPCVYTVHGWGWRGMRGLKHSLIVYAEKTMAKISKATYVLVSHEMRNTTVNMLKIPDNKIQVIQNGIETKVITPNIDRKMSEELCVIMPARVCAAKDHNTFFKALAQISYTPRVIVCGYGTDDTDFIQSSQLILGDRWKNVEFLGETNGIDDLLCRSDIFVLCSNYEALPISIIEAMRAGIPVIATDVGGVKELLLESSGKLIRKGNASDLISALEYYRTSRNRVRAGLSGRRFFELKFSADGMGAKLLKLYSDKSCLK